MLSTPPERLGFKASKQADGTNTDFPDARQEIEEGLHSLETLFNASVDKKFDLFELYVLRNILSVPVDLASWIRLSHYEDIARPVNEQVPTIEAIDHLRRKLAASRNVSRALTSEYSRNKVLLAQLEGILNSKTEEDHLPNLSFLPISLSDQPFTGQRPLTTNTQFALSQLPALKTTLIDLKAKLSTLKDVQLGFDTAKDEYREERRHYIEQRTKSHLERNGRSALADSGPLAGKQTDTAEVEALEKAANMFNPP